MSFIDGIKERAKKDLKTIVLPEAEDERTIRAAAEILSKKLAKLILLGNPDQIYADAKEYGVHVSDAVIVDPQNCGEKLDEYANLLYELRKNKGMTPEKARETILKDYTTFGVLMVKNNEADGLVSGACHFVRLFRFFAPLRMPMRFRASSFWTYRTASTDIMERLFSRIPD